MEKRIGNLDGFRMIAAFAVLFEHTSSFKLNHGFWTTGQNVLSISSQVAVSFFFVLSGFLITHLLLLHRDERPLPARLGLFYKRRILRIWPLYYLLFVICFLVIDRSFLGSVLPPGSRSHFHEHPRQLFLGYLSFFPNYTGHYFGGLYFLGPTWSLAVEEFFYIFFPIGFFLVGRRHLGKYLLTLAFVSIILFLFSQRQGGAEFGTPRESTLLSVYFFRYRIFCFAFGGLIAWSRLPENGMKRIHTFFSKRFWAITSGLLLLGLLAGNIRFGIYMHLVYTLVITFFLYAVMVSGIRIWMMNHPFVAYLGKISYGIYLLHPLAITIVYYWLKPWSLPMGGPRFNLLFFGGVAMLTVIMAALSFEFYEKLFLRLREKTGRREKTLPVSEN